MSVWHVEEYRCTQVRCTPPLTEPSSTELYYTMSVWYVEECSCTQVRCNPHPGHQTQCYRTLLHHVSLTHGWMQAYQGGMYTPPTNCSFIEKTSVKQSIKHKVCWKRQMYPSVHWARYYRALLHQVSMTYWRMQMYPVQIYAPANQV